MTVSPTAKVQRILNSMNELTTDELVAARKRLEPLNTKSTNDKLVAQMPGVLSQLLRGADPSRQPTQTQMYVAERYMVRLLALEYLEVRCISKTDPAEVKSGKKMDMESDLREDVSFSWSECRRNGRH